MGAKYITTASAEPSLTFGLPCIQSDCLQICQIKGRDIIFHRRRKKNTEEVIFAFKIF